MKSNFDEIDLPAIETLQNWIDGCSNIVFFGGAGVSTESGIPDFRSADGIYNQQYRWPPETILSHTFFVKKTDEFYRFYRDKMLCLGAEPNMAHTKLADLEKQGKLSAVITQNIDGLHQLAGSENVLELHGSVHRNYCIQCHQYFSALNVLESSSIPKCSCGGTIKPDVVLYEENLNDQIMQKSMDAIRNADLLIVGGTSLSVYPAAGMIDFYKGDKLVLINKSKTSADNRANLIIRMPIAQAFSKLK